MNRRFAQLYMADREAIGLHLAGGLDSLVKNGHLSGAPPARIVGIVGDARERGADRAPTPTVYTCFSAPNPAPWHVVRTRGDALAMARPFAARFTSSNHNGRSTTWLCSTTHGRRVRAEPHAHLAADAICDDRPRPGMRGRLRHVELRRQPAPTGSRTATRARSAPAHRRASTDDHEHPDRGHGLAIGLRARAASSPRACRPCSTA